MNKKINELETPILYQILRATIEDQDFAMLSDEHKEWVMNAYVVDLIYQELRDRDSQFWLWDIYE